MEDSLALNEIENLPFWAGELTKYYVKIGYYEEKACYIQFYQKPKAYRGHAYVTYSNYILTVYLYDIQ